MFSNSIAKKAKKALKNVQLPGGSLLCDYPGLSDIVETKNLIALSIEVPSGMEKQFEQVRQMAQQQIEEVAKGKKVMVSLTAENKTKPTGAAGAAGQAQQANQKQPVKGIKHIIAIGSGKGGVGKSTLAVNLALALAKKGKKIGLLDADIYGPSIPKLLKLEGKPAIRNNGIFEPFETYGIKIMSIGAMLEDNQAVIWRGPMASSALKQLLRESNWGEIDILLIDLPPGTGDIQISLVQQVELEGAIIISTPQDLALIDAKRALDMFNKTNVPILGIVENMSYFLAPDSGKRYDIFGHGGARQAAKDLGLDFLGEVPLFMPIQQASEIGEPVIVSDPKSDEAKPFFAIGDKLVKKLSAKS